MSEDGDVILCPNTKKHEDVVTDENGTWCMGCLNDVIKRLGIYKHMKNARGRR